MKKFPNLSVQTLETYRKNKRFLFALMCCLVAPTVDMLASGVHVEFPQVKSVSVTETVTGSVVDENGDPLVGVSVVEKGTNIGTATDVEGRYVIKVSKNATLTFSFIGYKPYSTRLNGHSIINVSMRPDENMLDDVVVVGYGKMKKRDLTGAISSVKNDVIKLTPTSNPMEALQGRVAGLDITRSSGQAGEGVTMQLRGNRSLTASGEPLFIIDGMPGDYATLNPNDIESIEVLKDASSTAVYGSEGSNGVIIITTKKGEAGKMRINFDAYLGFNGWSTLPKMNSARQNVYTRLLAQQEGGSVVEDFENQVVQGALERGETIDWVDALMQTGFTQNYSLSMSGGTERTQAYFSLNYSDEKGQYRNDEYKVYSSTMRINTKLSNWLSGGLHTQASYMTREKTSSHIDKALRADPFGKLYNDDGTLNPYPLTDNNSVVNLLLNQDRSVYRDNPSNLKLYVQPYIRITPLKGLSLESRISANFSYNTTNKYCGYGSYEFYDQAGTGALNATKEELAKYTKAIVNNSRSWGYTWENILTYNFKLSRHHEFTLTGVSTYSYTQDDSSKATGEGVPSNTMYWTNLGAVSGEDFIESDYNMKKRLGFVGRINYSFMGRYLFSASVRHDGDSRLASKVRWATFPAVSAGWRLSDEVFMDWSRDWVNNFKIRVGYGETGAAGISPYSSWSILNTSVSGLGDQQITMSKYPKNLTNSMLTWERSKSWNIGVDFGLFNNRIDLSAEYYITNTDGVIWEQNVPITNGGESATSYFVINRNIATTRNRGLELTLNTRNIVTRNFTWSSTLTFSNNKEEVTSLGEGAAEYVEFKPNDNQSYTLHIGDPVKSFRNYKIAGVWQYGEEADAAVFGRKPGDLKVSVPNMRRVSEGIWEKSYVMDDGTVETTVYDAENPYAVNANDRQILGHNTPDWSLGFSNTFTWKWFDLSIYMYFRHGQMFYYDPIAWYNSGGGNFPAHFNYWTSTNPSNDFPALDATRNWKSDEYYTSLPYVDGSFFKIKNITLGYTLPQSACRKIKINSLRVYGTITNPLVHANNRLLKGYDPEMNGKLDFPLTKQLVCGLSLSL